MNIDTEELRRLAEPIKGWMLDQAWVKPDHEYGGADDAAVGSILDGEQYPIMVIDTDNYDQPADAIKIANFYAAANPAMVLGLLDEITRLTDLLASRDREALKAMEGAYTVLGAFGHFWPGRLTNAGQKLLCDLRNSIAEMTGRDSLDVQDDYTNRPYPFEESEEFDAAIAAEKGKT